jgi:hypothetical protein
MGFYGGGLWAGLQFPSICFGFLPGGTAEMVSLNPHDTPVLNISNMPPSVAWGSPHIWMTTNSALYDLPKTANHRCQSDSAGPSH